MKTKRVPLIINKEHVRFSARKEADRCPTARAIQDQYDITVHVYCASIFQVNTADPLTDLWHTNTPKDLEAAILDFDCGLPFRTGVYFIDLPEELCSK